MEGRVRVEGKESVKVQERKEFDKGRGDCLSLYPSFPINPHLYPSLSFCHPSFPLLSTLPPFPLPSTHPFYSFIIIILCLHSNRYNQMLISLYRLLLCLALVHNHTVMITNFCGDVYTIHNNYPGEHLD